MSIPITPANLRGALDFLFRRLNELIPKDFPISEEDPNLQLTVIGLSLKVISHCKAANTLLFDNELSEALIILRSAFEALITMRYLIKKPCEVEHYQRFSEIVEFKDFLESYETSLYADFEKPKENLKGRLEHIATSEALQESRYFKGAIPQSDIENLEAAEIHLKNQFAGISVMMKTLQAEPADPYAEVLTSAKVYLYHKSSQHVHSHWHEVQAYHMCVDINGNYIQPSVSGEMALNGLLILLFITCESLQKYGPIPDLRKNSDAEMTYAFETSRSALKLAHPPPTERISIYRSDQMPK